MESPRQEKDEQDMEKIYVDLEQLKKRIDHFICTVEEENAEEPSRKKIKTLTTKTKRLLMQHKQVKEELQRYENEYKKALMKNAKILKRALKRDERKLEDLKEKCRTQGVRVEVAMMKMNHDKPEKIERPMKGRSDKRVFKGKFPTIKDKIKIKMRTKTKPAGRNIFKQKSARRSDNIKFQIQKNKDTGQRELFFFNTSNAKERFSNLVQQKEVKSNNFRECRIMLQKLTDEQAKKYTDKKSPEPRKNLPKSQESSLDNSRRKSSSVEPNWQIRIPKAVLEESQTKLQKMKSDTFDIASKTKRPRSTDKQQ